MNRERRRVYHLDAGEGQVTVTLLRDAGGGDCWRGEVGDAAFRLGEAEAAGGGDGGTAGRYRAEVDGAGVPFAATVGHDKVTIVRAGDGATLAFGLPDVRVEDQGEDVGDSLLAAPMPGKVTRLLVAPGERVERGRALAILEAMKMEHRFEAPRAGTVTAVHVAEGEQVEAGTVLLDLAADPAEAEAEAGS